MATPSICNSFFVAPFGIDGEFVGIGEWNLSQLSSEWLQFCADLLSEGDVFQTILPKPLNRFELKFTSEDGAAMATFSADGQIVASALYLRGDDRRSELDVLRMFVESLRRTKIVQSSQSCNKPFESVFTLSQRPLHIVVPWANPLVSSQDQDLVKELGNHIGGAFLCLK